ncbi:GntR family transcriptional regulator [Chelatococcus sp.]|uniref:GntR family transcriptional regulator n=1 Tax=Chelatococcus sp. TaxID=1953771 RepID=UPI0025BBE4C9|nr:GntR family transcriptional regulator [Chelatococcus sp.]
MARGETKTTAAQQATQRLRNLIMSGEFSADLRITETSLADLLGMSRTPVRAALSALSVEGLVEYEANRGYRIRSATIQDVLDAYTIRASLEGLACRLLAAAGASAAVLAHLEKTLVRYERFVSRGSLTRFDSIAVGELNQVFHQTILDQVPNRMLRDFVHLSQSIPLTSHRFVPHWGRHEQVEGARLSHAEHQEILRAIRQREADAAENAMRRHIDRSSAMVQAMYGSGIDRATPLARSVGKERPDAGA